MDRERLKQVLREVRRGKVSVEDALERLRMLPSVDLGYAVVDTHRAVRRGFPEVVYGPGKTPGQISGIVATLVEAGQTVLVTRVGPEIFEALRSDHPGVEYHEAARAVVIRRRRRRAGRPGVVVVTAGTADLGVGEEASLTAELMGQEVVRLYDVGIAGIHRLVSHRRTLTRARVIVAIAGMEGALPSVVAGLTDCPIIGVPTSTGYGTGSGGQAALLAMLNSCAAGLTVVNIDNGFGAGFAAAMINRQTARRRKEPNSG